MNPLLSRSLAAVLALCSARVFAQVSPADRPGPVSLRELSDSFEKLSNRIHPCVVQIFATGYATPSEETELTSSILTRQRSTASGVLVSADGFIVTNAHVVRGARRLQVRLPASEQEVAARHSAIKPEGKIELARVIGVDRETDLAVLKIDAAGLPFLTLGDSDELRQGQLVMAYGNPFGLEGSVSMGIVSSTSRQIKADDPVIYIQTDASINPGNSGGPLVNPDGKVMGINTFILSQSGGSEGIGFALPSNIVKSVYTQIRRRGHVHRGEIGVHAQTITPILAKGLALPQTSGVIVADVEPDGPADKAGLKTGDLILSLNGKGMENARQLNVDIYRYAEDDKVQLEILRGGAKSTADVKVTERHDDPERFADLVSPEKNLIPKLGILGIAIDKTLAAMLPEMRHPYGIVVAAGASRDLTTGTGLQMGDVIYSVNGSPVASVDALRAKLDEFKAGDSPVFQIERSGQLMWVAIEVE